MQYRPFYIVLKWETSAYYAVDTGQRVWLYFVILYNGTSAIGKPYLSLAKVIF